MSGDDLMALLDLGGSERASDKKAKVEIGAGPKGAASSVSKPAAVRHPTALKLDRWGMRRGEECLKDQPRLQALKIDAKAAADFHGAAFEPDVTLNEGCIDNQRLEFIKTMLETPEYRSLRASTMLNAAASELAAANFAEHYASIRKPDDEMERIRAANRALKDANAEVEEMEEAVGALGCGREKSQPQELDARQVLETYRAIRNDDSLRHICELAGRFRRLAQAKQRQKASVGMDEVVGVVCDNEVSRLLPVELGKLGDPLLALDTMRRLVERQTFCREMRGTEKVAKGPVIVCIDESGSMTGSKIQTAKALALAMAWIARHQNRWCALVGWSDKGSRRELALPPGKWNEAELMTWLSGFLNGGTEPPLDEMAAIYAKTKAPVGKTDILMITDGVCRIGDDELERFKVWKKAAKARMITLSIGCDCGDLENVSDETHRVRSIRVDEAGVGQALSI